MKLTICVVNLFVCSFSLFVAVFVTIVAEITYNTLMKHIMLLINLSM